jgi:hypothetical protein
MSASVGLDVDGVAPQFDAVGRARDLDLGEQPPAVGLPRVVAAQCADLDQGGQRRAEVGDPGQLLEPSGGQAEALDLRVLPASGVEREVRAGGHDQWVVVGPLGGGLGQVPADADRAGGVGGEELDQFGAFIAGHAWPFRGVVGGSVGYAVKE